MSLWSRIANAARGERLNREIDEELQSHLEEAIASGRDPRDARRAFGSALHAREASHSIRVAGWLESVLADVSFGWRQLCRNKVTSVAAVLSLALGIGSSTAIPFWLYHRPKPCQPHHYVSICRQPPVSWRWVPPVGTKMFPVFAKLVFAVRSVYPLTGYACLKLLAIKTLVYISCICVT